MNSVPDSRRAASWARVALVAAGLSLSACGGGDGPEPQPQGPATPQASVSASAGRSTRVDLVTLRGTAGLPRAVERRPDGSFAVSLSALQGPYVASGAAFDDTAGVSVDLFAWSADGAFISLNPLSTLQLAQLAQQEPRAMYHSIAQWAGTSFSAAQVAAADDAVADYLARYLDVPVPADLRGFATQSWRQVPGDPFEDLIAALLARLAERGEDLGTLAARLGRRAAACERAAVEQVVAGLARTFCPATFSRTADAGDDTLDLLRYESEEDGVLELQTRAGAIESIAHTLPDGRRFACADAGCLGASSRQGEAVVIAAELAADDGGGEILALDGSLPIAAAGRPAAEAAACRSQRMTVSDAAGSAGPECGLIDESGQGGSFAARRGATERQLISLIAPGSGRVLEIVVLGTRIVSIVLSEPDAATGQAAFFACQDTACQGAVAGTPTADPLGIGWRVQRITLRGTALQRLGADGLLDPGDLRSLQADVLGIIDPLTSLNIPTDCSGAAESIVATVDEDPQRYAICPPPEDASAATVTLDVDGVSLLVLARSANFESLVATVAPDGSVVRTVLDTNNGQRFACGRVAAGEPACDGIGLGDADAAGARRLTVQSATLREIAAGELVGLDRLAHLDGAVTIAAPPAQGRHVSNGTDSAARPARARNPAVR